MKGKDDKDRGSLFSNLQETLVPKGEGVVWDLGADQTWSSRTITHDRSLKTGHTRLLPPFLREGKIRDGELSLSPVYERREPKF